jgi:hypothetical protein
LKERKKERDEKRNILLKNIIPAFLLSLLIQPLNIGLIFSVYLSELI